MSSYDLDFYTLTASINVSSCLSAMMRTLFILLTFCTATLLVTEEVPLTDDGRIDYFRMLEQRFYPAEVATDDNGYRVFVRQFGDGNSDYYHKLFEKISPEERELYRRQTYEKLGLDPDIPPTLTLPRMTFDVLADFLKAEGKPVDRQWINDVTLNPWTLEQYPMLADWVVEVAEPLDAIAEAVRKPIFFMPELQIPASVDIGEPYMFLLFPWGQHDFLRQIVIVFNARIMYRIAQGYIDGAIDDKLTILRLGRLISQMANSYRNTLGIAFEGMAMAIPVDLNPEHPLTEKQIRRLLEELDALPQRATFADMYEWERITRLNMVQDLAFEQAQGKVTFYRFFGIGNYREVLPARLPPALSAVGQRPFDWDFVYRRVNEVYDALLEPPPQQKYHDIMETVKATNYHDLMGTVKTSAWEVFFRALLTRDGLEITVADQVISYFPTEREALKRAFSRADCIENMQRLVLAIKLYQLDNDNKLPSGNWAEKIVPYLGENPEQYFSCPSNPSPKGETTYALVQYGDAVPDSHETILLVELKEPVSFDKAVITVDEVLELPRKYRDSAPHPGGMNTARRSGAVLFLSAFVSEDKLSRLLGQGKLMKR